MNSHTLFYRPQSSTYFVQYLAQKVHNSEHQILLLTRTAIIIKILVEVLYCGNSDQEVSGLKTPRAMPAKQSA